MGPTDSPTTFCTAPSLPPPSRARFVVLAFLCSLALVLYIDRICISQATPSILKSLRLDMDQMGYVFSAFTLAYGLFEVPTGRWGDRFGSRGVLTRIVLWWSLFTALTGTAAGLGMLLVIRFLFGAGEAGALPNAARVIARWFPPGGRGLAQGLNNTAAQLGGALAPVLTQPLIDLVGWRWAFGLFGLLGVAWAAAFYSWFRDNPAEHPAVNEAERRLIGAADAPGAHPPVPWRLVLTSPTVWLLGGAMTCAAFAAYLYFTWLPTYLQEARGVSPAASSWLAFLVLAGGASGSTLGGILGDRLVRATGDRRRTLRRMGAGGLGLAALSILFSIYCDQPFWAAACIAGAYFTASIQLAAWWAAATEISGRHLGALFGLMNSMGVVGAFSSPVFVGHFIKWSGDLGLTGREQWDPVFGVFALVLAAGAGCWLFINPERSVVIAA